MRKTLLALMVCASSMGVYADDKNVLPADLLKAVNSEPTDAKAYRESIKNSLSKKGDIVGIQELPMKKLFFVEATEGTYIVSSDGRFVFQGSLTDVWHRKTIQDLASAIEIQRTPVSNIGFEPEEQLATFQVGNPNLPRQGVAFVDPTSTYTQKFMQHILSDPDKYNWTVILMPLVGGEAAKNRANRLWCAKDKDAALLDLANGTDNATNDLSDNCDIQKILLATMLTDVFQITNLPHIIREDGLKISGFPIKFDEWLAQP
jgi:thiol:disulfide interchange protein DsbC